MELERIAVIKLGSLGDVVQALGPFRAIRHHHAGAHLTLITTSPYVRLARATGYFDSIWSDGRPRRFKDLLRLLFRMRKARFTRVYDLQTSERTSAYFWSLFPSLPQWSGVAPFCSHPHKNPNRAKMHTVDLQAEQLALAGIADVQPADLSFADADATRFALPERFAVLVPGSSVHRLNKRWPAAAYGALAAELARRDILPVIIGSKQEGPVADEILRHHPGARSLVGHTDFIDIVALGRKAQLAVGNDTGPMHLLAAAGTPSLVLFSNGSDPSRCAPRGRSVATLQVADLAALSVAEVVAHWPALRDVEPDPCGSETATI